MKNRQRYSVTIAIVFLSLISIFLKAQSPGASFNVNQTAGCSPLSVQFTNTSVNASSYYWDFGNGNSSVLSNPSNVYSNTGIYTVKLIALSANGQMDSVVSTNLITVASDSISDFYVLNTITCLDGNTFSFINTSINSTSCLWDFGDGNTSTLQNPTHSYSSQGNYTVKLIAYNSYGCSDLKIRTNYLHVIANHLTTFTANTTNACSLNQVFNFTSTTSSANSWFWDFGDESSSTLPNPQHTYSLAGNYSVSLVTGNANGCYDTLVKNNYISIAASQIPSFTASTPSGCTLVPVTFTNTSLNSVSWLWNFGDAGTSTQQNPLHTYQHDGNYTISLTITTANNCSYTTTVTNYISVEDNAVSNFSINNATGCAPLNVLFTNLSSNDVSRLWEFGDGTSSTVENPSHTYTANGIYSVKLHSYNVSGCESVYQRINAVKLTPPHANFSANLNPGCAPLTTSFTNSSTNASQWLWDFGDGGTSTLQNPVHTYNFPGDYDVRLIVLNLQGCSDTLIFSSYIHVINTSEEYIPPPTVSGCVPLSTTFEDATLGAVSWLWDFGDGTSSTLQNPTHSFISKGFYTVSLTIELNGGCTQLYPDFRTFDVQSADAQFSFSQTQCPPYIVNFTDTTSENSSSWFWDFGNGFTSNQKDPIQGYLNPGFYTVIHTITTSAGCTAKVIESNLIHLTSCSTTDSSGVSLPGDSGDIGDTDSLAAPVPLSGCIPILVHFHNILPKTISWFWNFGDGSTSILENPIHNYTTSGNYDVTMIAQDSAGINDTLIYSDYIQPSGINTNFSFIQNTTCENTILTFTGVSPNAASWSWDFGDGTTSTLQNPTHTYSDSITNYTISLTTVNAQGCSGSMSGNVLNSTDNPLVWVDNTDVCSNQSVSFNCSSSNFSAYLWDFGDGTSSSLQNPTHTYLAGGTFPVTLLATSSNGCTHNFPLQNSITVQNPISDFTFALASGCNSKTVNFTNFSTGTSVPLSAHCKWNFGDGSPVLWAENAVHTYANPGTYQVTLSSNYNNNCINSITKTVHIYPTVVANFSSTQNTSCFPITVTYNDSSTTAISWLWNFGDGATSVLQNPIHTFVAPPTTGVTLTISDSSACIATKTKPKVTIFNTNFSMPASSGCAPLNVVFSDLSINASNWHWSFGDGTFSTLQNPTHSYLNNGAYQVILISGTTTGCVDTMVYNSIRVSKPTANFISQNPTNCSPTLVSFTDLSIGATSYLWDFGDGSFSINQNPAHIYNIPGLYTIKLIVTNGTGCKDTLTRTNYINVPGTIANFGTSTNESCAQTVIQFNDSSINAASWSWNFGDGTTSTQQNPSNFYPNPGQYSISLIVHDSFGCTSNLSLSNLITINPSPTSNFTVSDTVFCSPFSVSFYNHSQDAVTYLWTFGDGDTSTVENPSHIYLNSGIYTASLISTNEFGCSDSSQFNPIVSNSMPEAHFTTNEITGCSPLTVSFAASSSPISNAHYFWTFGNGSTSAEQTPSTSFINPGSYTISLIVANTIGCSDTVIHASLIEVSDFNPPTESTILFATVTSNTSTYLLWNQSTAEDFAYYKIYRKDNPTGTYFPVGTINTNSGVSFSDTLLNTLSNSYCYKVQTFDNCGYALPLDSLTEHCTINVTANGVNDHIQVNWTPYVGASVGTYSIYRMETGSTIPVLIATVPSTVSTIIDTNLYCPLDFSYRIKATYLNGNFISSNSDTSIARPAYNVLAHQLVNIVRSTVIDNSSVLTEWETPIGEPEKITGYTIYKSTDNINFNFLTTVNSLVHEFIDTDVDISEQNYYYKIEADNLCNVITMGSNKSSSILLKAELTNGSVLLNWTKYEEWNLGVDYYLIEKMDENGDWKVIKTVDGKQTSFADE